MSDHDYRSRFWRTVFVVWAFWVFVLVAWLTAAVAHG